MLLVLGWIAAVAAANLVVTALGPVWSVLTAFLMIGLALTTRDALHERWAGRGLWWRMALLVVAGGAVSAAVNFGALRIAAASSAAFIASELVDAATYHQLRARRSWFVSANGSNVVGALADSLLFPALAWGLPLLWPVIVGQWAAKTAGGALWSLLLGRRALPAAAVLLLCAAPARGQVVSLGVGVVETDLAALAVEAVAASPTFHGFGASLVASWEAGSQEPVLLPQASFELVRWPWIVGAGPVWTAGPWDDYRSWERGWTVRAIRFLEGPWKVIAVVSTGPVWVTKLDRTILSR